MIMIPDRRGISGAPPRQAWRRLAILWTFAVAYGAAVVSGVPTFRGVERTRQAIEADARLLSQYQSRYGRVPATLADLRAFGLVGRHPFAAYDAYGQRLDYLRLDDHHFILRSFGDAQRQSSLKSRSDPGFTRGGVYQEKGLLFQYDEIPTPHLFPAAVLAGAEAPNGPRLARLFVDGSTGTRRLVIRLGRAVASPVMVATHDAVEEFLWLPDGRRLVYTATGSLRHRDGVYLWDLESDSQTNLLDVALASEPLSPVRGGANFWLSLAGVSTKGPLVYFWQHPRHDGALDPADFFASHRLVVMSVPTRGAGAPTVLPWPPPASASPAGGPGLDLSPVKGPPRPRPNFSLASRLAPYSGRGSKMQQQWLALPMSGDVETVLQAWQQFCDRASGSPLFPYGLWILTGLYGSSAAALGTAPTKESEILSAYGAEIARALLNQAAAPSYLKALAMHAYQTLAEGRWLAMPFGRVGLGKGGAPLPSAPRPK